MSEDRLLRDLAGIVGEHDQSVARMETLCISSAAGSAELLPEFDTMELQTAVLRPLGGDFSTAMVERLAQELQGAEESIRAHGSAHAKGFDRRSVLQEVIEFLAAPLRAMAPRPVLAWSAATAVALFAVALTLGILREAPIGAGSLPGYQMSLQGKAQLRGDAEPQDGIVEFETGDAFRLLLRPRTALTGPVTLSAFVVAGGEVHALAAPPAQVLDNGVVKLEGVVGSDVILPADAAQLLIVLARPESVPDGAEVMDRLREHDAEQTPDWNAWKVGIHVRR